MRSLHLLAALLVGAAAACSGLGRPSASRDMAGGVGGDAALRVFLTGDMGGFVGPCGCEQGQSGGLPRRAAYLRSVRRTGDVAIDLGNIVTGDSVAHRLALKYALTALADMHYDVLVPGEGEIRLGAAYRDAVGALPVVCANLRRASDGARVFEPWRVFPTTDGRRVAVVGVAETFREVPAEYRMDPVADAVRAALDELAGRADAVVVAGSLRTAAAMELAPRFPSVALVAAGWPSQGSPAAIPTAGAPVMLAGEFGWYVGRVDLGPALTVSRSHQAWLDDAVPDDPEIARLVARYKAEASVEGAGFPEKLVASFRMQSFTGSETCGECHADEHAAWKTSGHAHAMQTLVAKGSASDPQCVACHLADVPWDNLAKPDTDRLGIGCEACHGGGARHAEIARSDPRASVRALVAATTDACLRCHSPPNDTHFDLAEAWPKIAHGKKAGR